MRTICLTWILIAAAVAPQAVLAEDNRTYFGVSMINMIYGVSGNDHRSTGLVGRLGYDFSRHLAAETHFGGSIGPESNASSAIGRAQMDSFYSLFLRLNSYLGTKRLYALGGISYGQPVLRASNSTRTLHANDVSGSLGVGLEIFGNHDISFDFELIRYFYQTNYSVDALNLGLVTRF